MRFRGLIFTSVLAAVLPLGGVVLAHADITDVSPAPGAQLDSPPEQILVRFEAELNADDSGLILHGPDGFMAEGSVDLNHRSMRITDLPDLADGRYEVEWTAAAAAGGEVTSGAIEFVVGTPAAQTASRTEPVLAAILVTFSIVLVVIAGRYQRAQVPV